MKTSIEQTYKHLLEESKIEPPVQIWDSISQNLDIDNVWVNISGDLELQTVRRFEDFGIVTSFVALFFAIYFISFPATNPDITFSGGSTVDDDVTPPIESEDKQVSSIALEELDEIVNSQELQKSNVGSSNSPPVKYVNETLNERNIDGFEARNDLTTALKRKRYMIISDPPYKRQYALNFREVPNKPTDYARKELFFGLTGSIKNTWILNSKTYSGFSAQELHKTKAIFGREFGLYFGLMLNPRISFLGEYYFTSNYRQAYNEYIGGHYVNSSFNVDYSKINLLMTYGVKGGIKSRGSLEVLVGPYVGILKNAGESSNKKELDLTDNYKNHILGLSGGIQKRYHLYQNIDLLTGLRLSYGITNIYKGTQTIPASFRITHPAAISISLGLRYNLERK